MSRTALIVIEIIIGVAAVGGEGLLVYSSRQMLAKEPGLTSAKTRFFVDMVMLDAIAVLMFVSAWLVRGDSSFARTLSIVSGIVVGVAVVARPSLTQSRQAVSSLFVVLGLLVVLLGIILPSPG
jgi:hypothetical protein